MDTRRTVSPESALASDIFDKFCSANTLKSILAHYRQLCSVLRIKPTHFPDFYPRLRGKLSSWRAQGLWAKFEKRASHKCYGRGKACAANRVLIIGSGPCGLRAAIEAQLLGAKVVLVEKRDRFSRNNVLHLWPFVITDLKGLGAKKFYGKFCAGSIDHISIRQLQCILLKVALLLGVEVHEGVSFEGLRSPGDDRSQNGWRCFTSPADHPVSHYTFDVLIGADGRRNTLDGFRRKALRAKLAIAITANFINKHTEAEARVKEISGVSYIFNQKFFQELNEATGIDLENIVYYKDETHYFVMTAKKQSLLQKGVLVKDHADTAKLLSHENISTEALMIYALEAAIFSTENQLPNLEFAVNHYGQPDVAMFDFTAMYQAENACRVVERNKQSLLMTLVGDSLLEPFWPTGSGCARGFLSSFDACWMLRSWAQGTRSPLEVMAERESIYRLLAQTTPENLNKEHTSYTIDPHSRYPNLNLRAVMPFQVKSLLDTDTPIEMELVQGAGSLPPPADVGTVKKRRRDSVIAVDQLLSWLRDQCQGYGLEVNDVRDAFSSGEVLCAIIHRFRPDLLQTYPLPSEENVEPVTGAASRNQLAFDMLSEEYGLQDVMSGWESVQGQPDFLSCVAYMSQVYEIFRGEIPQLGWGRAARAESTEDLEEALLKPSHNQIKYLCKPQQPKAGGRRSRMSSSGRESRGDAAASHPPDPELSHGRKHKKRRSEDRSGRAGPAPATSPGSANTGREIRTTFGGRRKAGSGGSGGDEDSEKNVPGLARDLEAKLKGKGGAGETGHHQKPKDLIRAIGKIEKTDWNVQLIEKKIAESKGPSVQKAERDDKVPKWSREAFDDKREALKRKMEGMAAQGATGEEDKMQVFEETMKKLGCKLREGNVLEVGQRGSNKVSAMAEQLVHKLDKGPSPHNQKEGAHQQHQPQQTSVQAAISARPIFEFPKKGGSECCHFCKERVYVVERMTAEGKYFHRNCFRCEYCNTALRVGNYVFDREGRYGDRFFCTSHYNTIWLYGWKKYDQEVGAAQGAGGGAAPGDALPAGVSSVDAGLKGARTQLGPPTSQQMLSEMDERGTTPERVEFENSVECASEDDLLSEMDEDEWTDRNFGASNADNLTPDEASDLSDDDITPEGIHLKGAQGQSIPERPHLVLVEPPPGPDEHHHAGDPCLEAANEKGLLLSRPLDESDSDTEVASGDDEEDDDEEASLEEDDELEEEQELDDEEDDDDEEEEDEEEEEEEGGGSTTEIETDSEFAEDPPHSVPGTIPTIVVEEPEQIVTRMLEMPMSQTQTPRLRRNGKQEPPPPNRQRPPPEVVFHIEDLNQRMVEPVKKTSLPERPLPRVTAVPKKWEPLGNNAEGLASKMSLELKKKYMMGGAGVQLPHKTLQTGGAAHSQFRSVLDMISEQQKLLQPAARPSATMQAFLDGAERLKQKPTISPMSSVPPTQSTQSSQSNHHTQSNQSNQLNHPVAAREQTQLLPPEKGDDGEVTPTPPSPGVQADPWNNRELVVVLNGQGGGQREGEPETTLSMNRLNLEKSGKMSPEGEKQDVGKEKREEPPLLLNGGRHGPEEEREQRGEPPVLMLLSSEGLSQSETETQSTIIAVAGGKGSGGLLEDEQRTPVAEKPFEHNLEPGKDRLAVALGNQGERSEEEEDTETETGEDPLSDELEEEEEEDFEEENERQVKREPPRVEIEDEFGGVTLAVDVDQEIDESVRMSSSSSRDSLNSGVFLETELSDWAKEAGEEMDGTAKDNNNLRRRHKGKGSKAAKPPLSLDLDDMDFMDVDGLSSPEDAKTGHGYSKLGEEEDGEPTQGPDSLLPDFSVVLRATLPHDTQPSPNTLERQQRPTYSSDEREEESVLSSSTPTVEESLAEEKKKKKREGINVPEVHEAVNPVMVEVAAQHRAQVQGKELPRKGPFSNARDSLDYRKMRAGPGGEPVASSRGLYSTWMKGSVGELQLTEENSSSSASTGSDKIPSPEMARKIEEIHKERAKQNDLIRSMVMGRIRKSPEKNSRRGSRGSLSPLGGGSSSGSGSSEHVVRAQVGEEQADSRRSSQNSILSRETEDELVGEEVETTTTSSGASIPHQKLVKSGSATTPSSTGASQAGTPGREGVGPEGEQPPVPAEYQPQYQPLFTSSPRFRQRPKFESPLSVYQSVTNPPTPVNPVAPSAVVTPRSEEPSAATARPKSIKIYKSHSPSFYRSMPDLSAFLVSPLPGHHPHHGAGGAGGPAGAHNFPDNGDTRFATPDVNKWELYKRSTSVHAAPSSADREKARQAARERARLKSDEELGLSPTDYANLKEKVRRKASIPSEDDVFCTSPGAHRLQGGSVPTTPLRETLRAGPGGRRGARPMSDLFDASLSLRPNVDFPMEKRNPFLVNGAQSATYPAPVIPTDNSGAYGKGEVATEWYNYHEQTPPPATGPEERLPPPGYEAEDGFMQLRLRMGPHGERKISPDKAKSMGWSGGELDPFPVSPPSYLQHTATSTPTHRATPSSLQARADGNWFFDSKSTPVGGSRPRSNTLSDLNLSPSSLSSAAERKNRKSKDRDRRRSLIQAVSDFFTIRGSSSSSTTSGGAPATGGGSTPASTNLSPSDKSNSQGSSSMTTNSGAPSNGHPYPEGAVEPPGKEKFSIFKLTPTKILQSAKERRSSKSREVLVSPPPPAPSSPPKPVPPSASPHQAVGPMYSGEMGSLVGPPKPARAAQYLSQPEMVIQRLTQSPSTYKSQRRSRGADTMGSSPALAGGQDQMGTLSIVASPVKPARSSMAVMGSGGYFGGGYRTRMREMQEIQLELESVDHQQRSLEARGVAVEKRIRGEMEPAGLVDGREEPELMEEWFTLVREKTRLARWEKELLVRAEQLELEARKECLEEQLDNSLLLKDDMKSAEEKSREIELLHQLRAVEEQRGKLLTTFHEDLRQYENEDADLEAKFHSSRLSPKESNV